MPLLKLGGCAHCCGWNRMNGTESVTCYPYFWESFDTVPFISFQPLQWACLPIAPPTSLLLHLHRNILNRIADILPPFGSLKRVSNVPSSSTMRDCSDYHMVRKCRTSPDNILHKYLAWHSRSRLWPLTKARWGGHSQPDWYCYALSLPMVQNKVHSKTQTVQSSVMFFLKEGFRVSHNITVCTILSRCYNYRGRSLSAKCFGLPLSPFWMALWHYVDSGHCQPLPWPLPGES